MLIETVQMVKTATAKGQELGMAIFCCLAVFSPLAWAQGRVVARATAPGVKPSRPTASARTVISSTRQKSPTAPKSRLIAQATAYTNGTAKEDDLRGEDPVIRRAAVEALGKLPGSIVVVDPNSGRVLTIVNQNLALSSGYQPCSTFKPAVALAALEEGVIEPERSRLQLGKKWYMTLQEGLRISNNLYFEKLGSLLGLNKLTEYARRFGFGDEPAGWGIEPEAAGEFPANAPPARQGGVGKVASFGKGISQTLLQTASFTSALANGGILYYLQYPRTDEEISNFQPRIKRVLDFGTVLNPVREGMEKAVLTGTARRAQQPDLSIMGKTGTCSENRMRLGWFSGYVQHDGGLVAVVLLRSKQNLGGGARASQVAGQLFRQLADRDYFVQLAQRNSPNIPPAAIQLPTVP